MNVMYPCLRLVRQRFAEVRDRVTVLYEEDEDFRDLCEEYEACVVTAARLESRGRSADAIRKEYGALVMRLEREMLRYLEEHPERHEN